MSELRRPRFGPGEIIVLIAIGVLLLIVVTGNHSKILGWLFSPVSAVVAVVMVVEYLLLKGSDRSAIYRRERDAAREIRRDDLLALREMETRLVELRARLGSQLERSDEVGELRKGIEQSLEETGEVLRILRGRI